MKGIKSRYTKEILIKQIKQYYKMSGTIPSITSLSKVKWAATNETFIRYFGSWKKALTAAGFDINKIKYGVKLGSHWVNEKKYKRPKLLIKAYEQEYPIILKENLIKEYQFSDK